MPFSISCESCGASFAIPDDVFERKVAGRVVTVRCKQCKKDIRVDGTKKLSSVAPGAQISNASVRPSPADEAPVEAKSPAAQQSVAEPAKATSPSEQGSPPQAAGMAPSGAATPPASVKVSPNDFRSRGKPEAAESARAIKAVAPVEGDTSTDADGATSRKTGIAEPTPATRGAKAGTSGALRGEATPKRIKPATAKVEPVATIWAVSFGDNDDRELTESQIAKELRDGTINGRTIVWTQGMPDWKAIADVPELAKHVVARVIPPPSRELPTPPRRARSSPQAASSPFAEPAAVTPSPAPSAGTRPSPKPAPSPPTPPAPSASEPLPSSRGARALGGPTPGPVSSGPFFPSPLPASPAQPGTTALDSAGTGVSPLLGGQPAVSGPPAISGPPEGVAPAAAPIASLPVSPIQPTPAVAPASPKLDFDFSLDEAKAMRRKPPLLWIGLGVGALIVIIVIAVSMGGSSEEPPVTPTPTAQVPTAQTPTATPPNNTGDDSSQTGRSGEQAPANRADGSNLLEPPRPSDGQTGNAAASAPERKSSPRGKNDFADAFAKELGK